MAGWDDVRRIAMALPEAEESNRRGTLAWTVREKFFAWERPLRASDRKAMGDAAPDGDILGVRVPDLDAKEAILTAEPDACFTIPHFAGYAAVLVRLTDAAPELLEELITEAWLARAPKRVAAAWAADHPLEG